MNKKSVVIIICSILLVVISFITIFCIIKNKKEEIKKEIIELNDITLEYGEEVTLKEIINEETNVMIDTNSLGSFDYEYEINNKIYKFKYNVIDSKKPLIMGSSSKSTTIGKDIDLVNSFMCGDNYDTSPNCYIEGDYNINKLGKYSLKYIAIDSSGNKSEKKFTLTVKKASYSSGSSSSGGSKSNNGTPIENYIDRYKKDGSYVGIDVSAWQDDIDWEKVKKDGVEFAILRIGYGPTSNGIVMDKWFTNNIKKASEVGIDLGVYFYSYAKDEKESIEQAKWIINELDGAELKLGIAFDWENWNSFNKYHVSFKTLNDLAYAFINEVNNNGYKGVMYSSAYYLNHIWKDYDNTWVAYYTKENDFKKPYFLWQLSSTGKVNGINGYVDIDILYDDKDVH